MNDTARPTDPAADALIERARALAPELIARAEQADRNRNISEETIQMLQQAGLFRILQPARVGGLETDFRVHLRVTREICNACGSTGWVYNNLSSLHAFVAAFPKLAQDEFWSDPSVLGSATVAPTGTAIPVDGGYRLSGQWSFASGCDHASWHMVGAISPARESGMRPAANFLLLPRSDYTIVDDWYAHGLTATGSKSIAVDDVFVPAHRALSFEAFRSGQSPGAALYSTPLYRAPLLTFFAGGLAATSIGMAEGALHALTEYARVRRTRGALVGGGTPLAEFAAVQSRVAEAAGLIGAADRLIAHDIDELLSDLNAGRPISVATRIRCRLNHALIVRFCVQAADAIYACTGGEGLYLSNRIQRHWRDIHAVAKHVSFNWDAVSTMYGQHALGLEPRGQY